MLTDAERTDTRRYLGYPAYGSEREGNMGWRFYGTNGSVEYRLGNLSASEQAVLRGYLLTLATLEQAIPEAGVGLDTGSAAGWVRNPQEMAERERLFDGWRRRLCAFLGVPNGPALVSRTNVTLVV